MGGASPSARSAPVSAPALAERLGPLAAGYGLSPGPRVWERLALYTHQVMDWNRRINLTGARDATTFTDEHIADALPLAATLPTAPFRGVDVGSGAGLPGVVLACLRPGAHWTLLEPSRRKSAFLAHIARELALPRLTVRRERFEQHVETHRGHYDLAVARALWPLAEWLTRGQALLRAGGCLLGLEGEQATPDLPATARRIPYPHGARQRAVIVLHT